MTHWQTPTPSSRSDSAAVARGWGAAAAVDTKTMIIFGGICGGRDEETTRLCDLHMLSVAAN